MAMAWCWGELKVNSLAPGWFQRNFRKVIFQLILVIDGWSISDKIVLKWMPMDLIDGKSTLVQVMAWCCQATSHYLSQCWPRSLSPCGVIMPQWVNPCGLLVLDFLGLVYSQSGRASYRQISWSLGAARLGVMMIGSFLNSTSISAALLMKFQSDWKDLNPNLAASA